ncbi:DNA helicase RNJ42_02709 [Nakaseomyces bracarensis]|uniref:DNA helicase n=1 Tax=Nakaseomyces bracarensis TaxID=273131 RepID=UPI0038712BA4
MGTEIVTNITDIIKWIDTDCETHNKTTSLYLQGWDGVVELKREVLSYDFGTPSDYQLDSLYNSKLPKVLEAHGKCFAALIFCSTRSSTIQTAKYLLQTNSVPNRKLENDFDDPNLQDFVRNSIAYYHAGLSHNDRNLVEQQFLTGAIKIICSTSALSSNMSLRANLVIIKGTKLWLNGELTEYPKPDILQMIRRINYTVKNNDSCAIIMTTHNRTRLYGKMVNGEEELDSSLHTQILETILNQISLGSICSIEDASKWLSSTFLYQKLKNQQHQYRLNNPEYSKFDPLQTTNIVDLVKLITSQLKDYDLISINENRISCSKYGEIMSRHCITFPTMRDIMKLEQCSSINAILMKIAKTEEFQKFKVKYNERKILENINRLPQTRYSLTSSNGKFQIIDEPWQKTVLLLQHELGSFDYKPNSKIHLTTKLSQEKIALIRSFIRILKCVIDLAITNNDGLSLRNALFLLTSLAGKCWENSPLILLQMKSINLADVTKLNAMGITSIDSIRRLTREKIEYYLGGTIGSAHHIWNEINSLPEPAFKILVENYTKQKTEMFVKASVTISVNIPNGQWLDKALTMDFLGLKKDGKLVDFRKVSLSNLRTPKTFNIEFQLQNNMDFVEFHLKIEEIAGIYVSNILNEQKITDMLSDEIAHIKNKHKVSDKEIPITLNSSSDEDLLDLIHERRNDMIVPESRPKNKLANKGSIHNSDQKKIMNDSTLLFNIYSYEKNMKSSKCDKPSSPVNSRRKTDYLTKKYHANDQAQVLNSDHYVHRLFKSADKFSRSSISLCTDDSDDPNNFLELNELSRDIKAELGFLGSDIEID